MDRQQLKIISALLALLMVVSPISSLAMQSAMTDSQSSHCQSPETDSQSFLYGSPDYAQCTMENCAENCSASRHCSSQAPIILTLHEAQIHFGGHDFAVELVQDAHLFMHPSGLYRPPRA